MKTILADRYDLAKVIEEEKTAWINSKLALYGIVSVGDEYQKRKQIVDAGFQIINDKIKNEIIILRGKEEIHRFRCEKTILQKDQDGNLYYEIHISD